LERREVASDPEDSSVVHTIIATSRVGDRQRYIRGLLEESRLNSPPASVIGKGNVDQSIRHSVLKLATGRSHV